MSDQNKNFQKQVDDKLRKSNPQPQGKARPQVKQQQGQPEHPKDQNDDPDEEDRMVPDKIDPGVAAGDR